MTPKSTPQTTPRLPKTPVLSAGDYIAWFKFATGAWDYDIARGTIINHRTKRPVVFRKNADGRLTARAGVGGMKTNIFKNRAIWIVAHGILGLPLDDTREIVHINRDKCDCRIRNLRLTPAGKNPEPAQTKRLPPETIREIRRTHQNCGISCGELAREHHRSESSISRILGNKTYRKVTMQ